MTENNIYLCLTVILYLSFLIICGFLPRRKNVTANDYFLSGRNLSPSLFLFIATATSFSGTAFLMNPVIIFRDGFQSSYISFVVIIIPLTGVLFLRTEPIQKKPGGIRRIGGLTRNTHVTYFPNDRMHQW